MPYISEHMGQGSTMGILLFGAHFLSSPNPEKAESFADCWETAKLAMWGLEIFPGWGYRLMEWSSLPLGPYDPRILGGSSCYPNEGQAAFWEDTEVRGARFGDIWTRGLMKKKATGRTIRRKEDQGPKCQAFSRGRKMLSMMLAGVQACKDSLTALNCTLGRCRFCKGSESLGCCKSSFNGTPPHPPLTFCRM